MTKDISTLKVDMERVLVTGEGFTQEISDWVADDLAKSLNRQFGGRGPKKRTLRASNLGTPCERKLWYSVNSNVETEPLPASTLNKFIFGDITESYILGLVKAAGHDVQGLQGTVDICGIRGSRDCIIDGVLCDVKSASSRSFEKFKYGKLREDDPFGYISQLSSYLYGSQSDPLLKEKDKAFFLAFDKQFGHIAVDIYDLSEEVKGKEAEVKHKKALVKGSIPNRPKWKRMEYNRSTKAYDVAEVAEDWKSGESGNRKLSTNCSYCDYKTECWPDLRTFIRTSSVEFLTKVVKEPGGNVFEKGQEKF